MVGFSVDIFWLSAIGIKKFHRAFFEKNEFENFEYFEIFLGPDTVYYSGGGNFGLSLLDFLGLWKGFFCYRRP